jgi:hypothetical protein
VDALTPSVLWRQTIQLKIYWQPRKIEDIFPNCLELAFFGKQEGNFPKLEVIFRRRFFLIESLPVTALVAVASRARLVLLLFDLPPALTLAVSASTHRAQSMAFTEPPNASRRRLMPSLQCPRLASVFASLAYNAKHEHQNRCSVCLRETKSGCDWEKMSPRHSRHFVTSLRFVKPRNFDGNLRKFVILIGFYQSS